MSEISRLVSTRRIAWSRAARNGMVPDANFASALARGFNQAQAWRRKEVFNAGDGRVPNFAPAAGSTVNQARFRCHTGYAATHLVWRYVLIPPDASTATNPTITFKATRSGPVTVSETVHFGAVSTGGTITRPDQWRIGYVEMPVLANTTYECEVESGDGGICFALEVHEKALQYVDTSVNYHVDPTVAAGQLITADPRSDLLVGTAAVWRRNGSHLLNYTTWDNTPRTIASTTYTNVHDATTGGVVSSSVGWINDGTWLQGALRTSEEGRLPYATLCAYANISAGAGTGQIRLESNWAGADPTLIEVTGIGTTAQWYTTNAQLGAGAFGLADFTKFDLQGKADSGGATLSVHAASLYLYQT